MTETEAMELAIEEARKCDWSEEELDHRPKVGAVITIGDELIAAAHRGKDEHAEKIALANVPADRDLSRATVWTTLEPCTATVRTKEGDSCTERLRRAQVRKVMIGILDPNQGVCGKGLLSLQESGIEVGLFPHPLAIRIRRLNDRFIQAQQSLGIQITFPLDGTVYTMGELTVRGTYKNPPKGDVFAMTYVTREDSLGLGGGWWPQEPVRCVPDSDNEWEATVQFGAPQLVKVCIVKANELGRELIGFYDKLKQIRRDVILGVTNLYCRDTEHVWRNIAPTYWGLPVSTQRKGLDVLASVNIQVVNGDPAGLSELVR
jgi:pyrimidine deaminase RibD-like protein